jgi:hypothetical protein
MFNNLSAHQKFIIFTILVVFLSILIYKNNIAATIRLYEENKQLQTKTHNDDRDVIAKCTYLKRRLNILEKKIGNDSSQGNPNETSMLDRVTKLIQQNGLVLNYFPQSLTNKQKNYLVTYYNFTVEGGFVPATSLIYELEKNSMNGCIRSVEYKTVTNFMNKKTALKTTIYFQVVKKDENE